MAISSGNLKQVICNERSKHDEIYLKHDNRNVNQISWLHDINWKACLRKITSGGAIKDLDSSHPHFKRHDTN